MKLRFIKTSARLSLCQNRKCNYNPRRKKLFRRGLQGLEQKGWVSKLPVPQLGKPDKNIYSVTEEGKQELLRWLADGNFGLSPRTPILMKVFFLGERSREENIQYFKRFIGECEQFLKGLEPVPQYIEVYSDLISAGEKSLYWQMTVDYGRRNMQMYIDWAQSCIERLEETK